MKIETNRIAGTGTVSAGARPVEAPKTTAGAGRAPNGPLTVGFAPRQLSAGSVDAATLDDLKWDDAIGRLVDDAMTLSPPPMPRVILEAGV